VKGWGESFTDLSDGRFSGTAGKRRGENQSMRRPAVTISQTNVTCREKSNKTHYLGGRVPPPEQRLITMKRRKVEKGRATTSKVMSSHLNFLTQSLLNELARRDYFLQFLGTFKKSPKRTSWGGTRAMIQCSGLGLSQLVFPLHGTEESGRRVEGHGSSGGGNGRLNL